MNVNSKKMLPLTPRQKEIVDFISVHFRNKGYAPSLSEIAQELGLNAVSTVHQHLEVIIKKGYLQKDSFQPRSIATLAQNEHTVEVPLLGSIAAGNPITPYENPEPISVPDFMIKNGNDYYALEVKGDSMIEDDVWDGDTILIKHQKDANVGDMIVAVVDGEVTLKRFGGLNEEGKVILTPKNPHLKPFYVDPDTFEVRGKFAGLLRRG